MLLIECVCARAKDGERLIVCVHLCMLHACLHACAHAPFDFEVGDFIIIIIIIVVIPIFEEGRLVYGAGVAFVGHDNARQQLEHRLPHVLPHAPYSSKRTHSIVREHIL